MKKKIKKFAIFCSYSYIERQKKATKWKEYHRLKNQKWKHEDFNICFVYKPWKLSFGAFEENVIFSCYIQWRKP